MFYLVDCNGIFTITVQVSLMYLGTLPYMVKFVFQSMEHVEFDPSISYEQ